MVNNPHRPCEAALARYTCMGVGKARIIQLIQRSPLKRLTIAVGSKEIILKLDADKNVTLSRETLDLLALGDKGYSDQELIDAVNHIASRTGQTPYQEVSHDTNSFYR
jgi:hypothetical protein